MNIRPLEPRDRERIHEILRATERFTQEEIRWAMDLVDDAIAKNNGGGYIVQVLEEAAPSPARIQGYVCYGPTPRAEGVYDLYWIAVDPARQVQGLGRLLLRFVETEVRRRHGRMLLIETRSRESFAPTRHFYRANGYEEITRIKDFYRVEDDKIVFCKKLGQQS